MIKIKDVLSWIWPENQVFRNVAYEWEDETAKCFNVPVRKIVLASGDRHRKNLPALIREKTKSFIKTIFPAASIIKQALEPNLTQDITAPLSLCYFMSVYDLRLALRENCIPIFIDIWSNDEIDYVIRRTRNLKLFYVTSRDVFNRLRKRDPSSSVRYMPLSVSDIYYSDNFSRYRKKTIDAIQFGRKNPVLHEYMLRYAGEHSNIRYVYRSSWKYTATSGPDIGEVNKRKDFMSMIAEAKVVLLGCSGVDGAREGTNGICYPTPRFYEAAVLGCALIGRYPDNQEFRELNMSRYCPNITSYEQFCECLERALAQTPEELYAQNHDFIINSLTSKRAEQIQKDLAELTGE